MAGDPDRNGPRELIRASGQYMGYGLTWALSVLLFLGMGAWLDAKLGTSPVLLVIGAFLGAGAGFYSLYYHIVIEPRRRQDGGR
ncbi:MAG: AtpZ/AtpI family protein [Gemmatimonadota bacterium]|jgi:F0F1-type ATP synthase assembly protein I